MKREILFKGKSINTGEWVESMTIKRKRDDIFMEIDENKWIGIEPKSLSQFINQKDKNGKKVFEGDYDADGICIVWCENCNGFEFAQLDITTKYICISCHRCDGNFFFGDHIGDFEIVGNISD
jgi:hypothetical protein